MALVHDVNLIDTTEIYPVPPHAETQGSTECYIGSWLNKFGKREQVLIATKATGPTCKLHNPSHVRDGINNFDRTSLTEALYGRLERLQTDYVDLYQLHWPDRRFNYFGTQNYHHITDEDTVPIEETLSILADFITAGKIRHIGISNETPWGIAQFLRASEKFDLPRVVSIQNPYSRLNHTFETGHSEFSYCEQVSLPAYSPLEFGVLSGKHLNGAKPSGGRLTLFKRLGRYNNLQVNRVIGDYVALACKHGLDPKQMALGFVNSRGFVISNIIYATTLQQLQSNLDSVNLTLDEEILNEIEAIHQLQPNSAS